MWVLLSVEPSKEKKNSLNSVEECEVNRVSKGTLRLDLTVS